MKNNYLLMLLLTLVLGGAKAQNTKRDAFVKNLMAKMTVEEKMKLLNAQEHANAILTDNDGERVICERHKPINSRIGSVLCVTLAERNNMRDAGKNGVVRLQQTGRKEHVQ